MLRPHTDPESPGRERGVRPGRTSRGRGRSPAVSRAADRPSDASGSADGSAAQPLRLGIAPRATSRTKGFRPVERRKRCLRSDVVFYFFNNTNITLKDI